MPVMHLMKVVIPWHRMQICTVSGHIVTPLGMCTVGVEISRFTFLASCLVYRDCSELILLVYFLREYEAIRHLHEDSHLLNREQQTA